MHKFISSTLFLLFIGIYAYLLYQESPPLLPTHIQWLEDNHWTIHKGYPQSERNGETNYLTKQIIIHNNTRTTLYHEVGHAICHSVGFPTLWQSLYESENVKSPNAEEYIAWAFAEYYTSPRYLKYKCPETYRILGNAFFQDSGIDMDYLMQEVS